MGLIWRQLKTKAKHDFTLSLVICSLTHITTHMSTRELKLVFTCFSWKYVRRVPKIVLFTISLFLDEKVKARKRGECSILSESSLADCSAPFLYHF